MSLNKQGRATSATSVIDWSFPDRPKLPVFKTIGGDKDKAALEAYREAENQWYSALKTSIKNKSDEVAKLIYGLAVRVEQLEKKAK